MTDLQLFYRDTRKRTETICNPLEIEDYVVQPIIDVSPPKWHLGHTTWFFEAFILAKYVVDYQEYDLQFAYVFNSYYESMGKRVVRTNRGNLSRPTVAQVYEYRAHVDTAMYQLLEGGISVELRDLITIGIHHEKQHQELLLTDIKYILGNNPLLPPYDVDFEETPNRGNGVEKMINVNEGLYTIGHQSTDFCYDNELGVHQVYVPSFRIASTLVSNRAYLEFVEDQAYQNPLLWHAEAWDWLQREQVQAPLYWHCMDGVWQRYGLAGLRSLDLDDPVTHVSYFEAFAFAQWADKRLPTEFEWEIAQKELDWGTRWEWTESSYLPYPGYAKAPGALGEYNGKFMVNQKVLRGGSVATPDAHTRHTYRNFFHPQLRWQFTGIRLAQ